MSVANWEAIENAIQAQVVAATGLAGASVRWADQSRDAPASGDSVRLAVLTGGVVGHAEESTITNPAPSAGQEIILRSHEQAEFEVQVQVFTMSPTGNSSAFAQANNVARYLQRDDVTDTLFASKLALVSVDNVQRLPLMLETEFQGRALFTARFRTLDGSEYATTYIETAEWVGTYN